MNPPVNFGCSVITSTFLDECQIRLSPQSISATRNSRSSAKKLPIAEHDSHEDRRVLTVLLRTDRRNRAVAFGMIPLTPVAIAARCTADQADRLDQSFTRAEALTGGGLQKPDAPHRRHVLERCDRKRHRFVVLPRLIAEGF